MTHKLTLTVAILFLGAVSFLTAADEGKTVKLFDGRTLNGWVQRGGAAKYTVEDGCIVGHAVPDTGNTFLCTEKEYSDFILEGEFKTATNLNSGIQIRSHCFDQETQAKNSKGDLLKNAKGEPIKVAAGRVHGYQMEIDPSARAWTGGIYDEARRGWINDLKNNSAANKAFKQGDWNKFRIQAHGDSIQTWINDVPAADLHDSATPKGFIGLQVHAIGKTQAKEGLEVRFRKLVIREMDTAK